MKATIIDVRSKLEFAMGHPKNAKNIPLNRIQSSMDEIKKIDTPIVMCCMSGARSGQAVDFLKSQGIKNVHNAGNWKNAERMAEEL